MISPTPRRSPRLLRMSSSPSPGTGSPSGPPNSAPSDLVPGADGEDDRARADGRGQPAAGPQPAGGQYLRQVLAPAHQVDVAVDGDPLVGVDLGDLDRDTAEPGPAGQHEQVPAVTVGAEQVRVDPDQPDGRRSPGSVAAAGTSVPSLLLLRGSVRAPEQRADLLERRVVRDHVHGRAAGLLDGLVDASRPRGRRPRRLPAGPPGRCGARRSRTPAARAGGGSRRPTATRCRVRPAPGRSRPA